MARSLQSGANLERALNSAPTRQEGNRARIGISFRQSGSGGRILLRHHHYFLFTPPGYNLCAFVNRTVEQLAKPAFCVYGAKILSKVRNRGWRLPEIIVDDTSQNILPSNQTFCTPLRARHRKVLADALVRA